MNENEVFIYSLNDPRSGDIRYIGKTKRDLHNRLNKHIQYSKSHKLHVSNWIRQLINIDLKPTINIIEICNEENWIEREVFYIKYYRENGCDLTNLTNGGDGLSGYKKIGKPHTQEAKDKISIKNKKIIKSVEWKLKIEKSLYIPIYGLNENGEKISFESLKHAALHIGNIKYRKNICQCLKGRRPTAYKYKWFYENLDLKDKEL